MWNLTHVLMPPTSKQRTNGHVNAHLKSGPSIGTSFYLDILMIFGHIQGNLTFITHISPLAVDLLNSSMSPWSV